MNEIELATALRKLGIPGNKAAILSMEKEKITKTYLKGFIETRLINKVLKIIKK